MYKTKTEHPVLLDNIKNFNIHVIHPKIKWKKEWCRTISEDIVVDNFFKNYKIPQTTDIRDFGNFKQDK